MRVAYHHFCPFLQEAPRNRLSDPGAGGSRHKGDLSIQLTHG
jgi:hypothetical protein